MKVLTKVLLATIAAFGLTMNAQAYDWKSAPGASCQSYFGSQESQTNKTGAGIQAGSRGVWVNCSVPRDRVTVSDRRTVGIWVHVRQYTRCYSRSNRGDGTAVQVIAGAGIGWIYLPLTQSVAYGSYDVYCYLPPRGMLNTVLLREIS